MTHQTMCNTNSSRLDVSSGTLHLRCQSGSLGQTDMPPDPPCLLTPHPPNRGMCSSHLWSTRSLSGACFVILKRTDNQ